MRKKINTGWQFFKAQPDTPLAAVPETDWQPVSLPHDWLIGQTDDLYESGDGWYVKTFLTKHGSNNKTAICIL